MGSKGLPLAVRAALAFPASQRGRNPRAKNMLQHLNERATRLFFGIATMLFQASFIGNAQAADYRFDYSGRYLYPNDYLRFRQDMNQLDDRIRRQQRIIEEQTLQQQELNRLLRQNQSAQHQVTAMQACYYRLNGGLDLCEGLFDSASSDHSACVKKAFELNPGCDSGAAGRKTGRGD
jgi:hypothetical protein